LERDTHSGTGQTPGARQSRNRFGRIAVWHTNGDRVILIASNYGGPRHPAWYHNVKVNPTVTLYAGGFEGRFVGAEVHGAERDRLWSTAKQWLPGYDTYESSAGDRQIPILAFTEID